MAARPGFAPGAPPAIAAARRSAGDRQQVDLDQEPLVFSCRAVVIWVDRDRRELAGVFTHLDTQIQEQIMAAIFARSARVEEGTAIHA